jgi:hypothetical protein
MKTRLAWVLASALLAGSAPVLLAQEKADPPEAVDTSSDEAKSLEKKLHVPGNWRSKAGTVDLTYAFAEESELLDWKWQGQDKVAYAKPGPKEPNPISGLECTVSSEGTALGLLDPVEFIGDFTIEWTIKASFFGTSSELVFLVGSKGSDGIGVRWGSQLVRMKKGKLSPITQDAPSQDRFAMQKVVDVKLVRVGDELQVFLNKIAGTKKKFARKELDGKIGLLISTNLRVKVKRFHITGAIVKP